MISMPASVTTTSSSTARRQLRKNERSYRTRAPCVYNLRPMKSLVGFFVIVVLTGCSGNAPTPQQPRVESAAPAPVQKAPDEDAALAAITMVNAAQKDYMARNRRYALTYEELMQGLYLKEEPVPEKTGYDISLRPTADAARYTIIANPATPSSTARHFFSDQTGEIRAEQGKDANAQSPTVNLPR